MGDGYDQYYPALAYIGQYGREFLTTFFKGQIREFDFSIGMGDDVIGTLSYYGMGDPLNWLAIFVQPKNIAYLYSALLVFRWYLGGIAFIWFVKRKGNGNFGAVVGALAYSFCSYALSYNLKFFAGFGNVLYLLPIALAGIDDLLEKRRKLFSPLLSVGIFLQALCGFYFLYMESIFLVIYFCVRFFCVRTEYFEKKNSGIKFVLLMLKSTMNYILGLGMGAVIFLPSIQQFFQSSRTDQVKFSIWNFLKLPEINQCKNALLHLFCMDGLDSFGFLVVFLPVLFLLIFEKKDHRDLKWLTVIALVMYFIPGVSYVFSAFAYYETRWTFLLFFVASWAIAEEAERLDSMSLKQRVIICSLFGGWSALCMGLLISDGEIDKRQILLKYGILFILLVVCIWGTSFKQWRYSKIAGQFLIIITVTGNLIFCGLQWTGKTTAGGHEWYWQYKSYQELAQDYFESVANTLEDEEREDQDFYRINGWDASKNQGLFYGTYSTNEYFSCMNGSIGEFWRKLQISSGLRGEYSFNGLDNRKDLEALCSVRYEREFQGGKKKGERKKVTDTLPVAAFYSDVIMETELEKVEPLDRGGILLQAVALENCVENSDVQKSITNYKSFPREAVEYKMNIKNAEWKDGIYKADQESSIEVYPQWTDKMKNALTDGNEYTGNVYALFDGLCYDGIVSKVYINGNEISTPQGSDGNDDYTVHITIEDTNKPILIEFPTAGSYKLEGIRISIQDMSELPGRVAVRNLSGVENTEIGVNTVQAQINPQDKGYVFFSIPYSKNWSAFYNGDEVEIIKADYGFMAVEATSGIGEIELKYHSMWLEVGRWMMFISCLIFFLLYRMEWTERRKG